MSSILRALLWKEWRERRVALAFGCLWMIGAAVYAWGYARAFNVRAPIASYFGSSLMFSIFVPVFLAMRTSAGELTKGTLGFTRSIPASIRQLALIRLGGGIVCLVVPIVVGAILLTIPFATGLLEQAQRRPAGPWTGGERLPMRPAMQAAEAVGFLWLTTTIAASSAATLFVGLSAVGTRLRTESQIGFAGAVITLLWLVGSALGPATRESKWWGWTATLIPHSIATSYGYQEIDGTGYTDLDVARTVWLPLVVNLLLVVGLSLLFARQYARLRTPRLSGSLQWRRRIRGPQVLSRLRIRWPGRVPALIWLDLRQSVPMCLAGLLFAVVMTSVDVFGQLSMFHQFGLHPAALVDAVANDAAWVAGHLPGSMWIVAMFWAAIVGAGGFAAELSPRLGQFWRSRPVSPGLWFWTKYVVGLVAVLGVLDLTTVAVSWNAPRSSPTDGMNWSYIYCCPVLHAATFSVAVAIVCWLRRPAVSAAMAIGLFLLTDVAMTIPPLQHLTPLSVHNRMLHGDGRATGEIHGVFDPAAHGYWQTYGVVAGIIVLATLCAWRGAIREEVRFAGWPRRIRSSVP